MRRSATLAFLLLPALATAQGVKNRAAPDTATFGLRGKVHSQRLTTRRLAGSPVPEGMFYEMIAPPPDWLVFDRNGFVIELANVLPEDGSSPELTRNEIDAQGRLIESVHERPDGPPDRTVYRYGEYGPLQVKTFLGDKLLYTEAIEYDDRGNVVRSTLYRGARRLLFREESSFDEDNHRVESIRIGPKGEILEHAKERFDEKGDLVESDELDSQGRAVNTMVFKKDVLVSWRVDPAYRSSKGIIKQDQHIGPYTYELEEDGGVVTFVHHNSAGISWGYDDQAVEALDQNGNIFQKVAFQYERDSEGNWTRRVASALDPRTGSMIAIQEDVREITYY